MADVGVLVASARAATNPFIFHSIDFPTVIFAKGDSTATISLLYAEADRGFPTGAENLALLVTLFISLRYTRLLVFLIGQNLVKTDCRAGIVSTKSR